MEFLNTNNGVSWALSKNQKYEFKTFDFAILFKKRIVFFTIRYFFKPTSKETRKALKELKQYTDKVRKNIDIYEGKERKEIELGILQISWFNDKL